MGRDRNWIDKVAYARDIYEIASYNPISLISAIHVIVGGINKGYLAPFIWNSIYEICALTQSLAGDSDALVNPIIYD